MICQHIIGIKTQERIAVEQQRRQTTQNDHVVGQRLQQTRLGGGPNNHGHAGESQLDQNPSGTHDHAGVFTTEHAAGGCIDIGHRKEHQHHDAHLVNLAAPALDCVGVAHLVNSLHDRIDGRHQE